MKSHFAHSDLPAGILALHAARPDTALVEDAARELGLGCRWFASVAELLAAYGDSPGIILLDAQPALAEAGAQLQAFMAQRPEGAISAVVLLVTETDCGEDGSALEEAMRLLPSSQIVVWPTAPKLKVALLQSALATAAATIELQQRLAGEASARLEADERLRACEAASDRRIFETTAAAEHRAGQLRALASELTQSEQRERRRLARILHDDLQQMLVAARMKLGALRRRVAATEWERPVAQIDELLDRSISESRSLSTELSPPILYDGGLVAGIHWLARHFQERHGLYVDVDAVSEADPVAEDIRVMVFQAVRDLLLNVVEHAGADRAEVTVARRDGRIVVEVADLGRGFDPATLERHGEEGGFGLFSLRERLQLMGGRLTIESAPGRGTRVTVISPPEAAVSGREVEYAPSLAAPSLAVELTTVHGGMEKIRVLLADDHEILREGLATLLKEEPDIDVVGGAGDGQTAIDLAMQVRPDVIVMDVTMPRMNGVEATRRIVEAMPEVRVIGLSMHDEQDMAAAMLEAGAADYLPKGDSSEALIESIRHWWAVPPAASV